MKTDAERIAELIGIMAAENAVQLLRERFSPAEFAQFKRYYTADPEGFALALFDDEEEGSV